jgi:hypothetical protein
MSDDVIDCPPRHRIYTMPRFAATTFDRRSGKIRRDALALAAAPQTIAVILRARRDRMTIEASGRTMKIAGSGAFAQFV